MTKTNDVKEIENDLLQVVDVSQPLSRLNEQNLINFGCDKTKQEKRNYVKKIFSNLSIFVGVYLTYASSLVIFQFLLSDTSHISNPAFLLYVFIFGLFLTIAGVGRYKEKSDRLIYISVPLMSIFLGTLFSSAPKSWEGFLLFMRLCVYLFMGVLFIVYAFMRLFVYSFMGALYMALFICL